MKLKFITILMIFIATVNCSNNNETEIKQSDSMAAKVPEIKTDILDIKNENYQIKITKYNRNNISNFTNSYHITPFLGIRAECISLKDLIGILTDIDPSLIIMSRSLENQYFNVLVNQIRIDKEQDLMIKKDIIKALDIKINEDKLQLDSTIVSIDDRGKYLRFANKVIQDTITSKYSLTSETIEFENMLLKDILVELSKVYDRVFILQFKEEQRINFNLERSDWKSTKMKLESELGLGFKELVIEEVRYKVSN